MTLRQEMYEYSKEQIKADKRHAKKLASIVKTVSASYLVWWALFQSKNPDYEQSSNSQYPEAELQNELSQYAYEHGFTQKQVANNDELLDYAVVLFTSVIADRVINYTRTQLLKDKTFTAEQGANLYNLVDNELSDDIIDEPFFSHVWSTDIWKHQAELRSDLLKVMRQTLLNRENPMSSVKDIRDKYHVFNYQAERILRTEGARISGQQQASDIKNADVHKAEWIASAGACDICRHLDGKVFGIDKFGNEPYVLPRHPSCRCAIAGYYDEDINVKTKKETERDDDSVLQSIQKLDGVKPQDLKNIKNIVDNAPKDIQHLYKQFSDGNIETGTHSYYSPANDTINLKADAYTKLNEQSVNPKISYGTLFHEMGHKVDYRMSSGGVAQSTQNGLQASVKREYKKLAKKQGFDNFTNTLSFIQETHGTNDWGGFSDIINGASNGKMNLGVGHYNKKGLPDKNYYSSSLGDETFANLFEATALNSDGRKLFEKYFPETTAKFDGIIRGNHE